MNMNDKIEQACKCLEQGLWFTGLLAAFAIAYACAEVHGCKKHDEIDKWFDDYMGEYMGDQEESPEGIPQEEWNKFREYTKISNSSFRVMRNKLSHKAKIDKNNGEHVINAYEYKFIINGAQSIGLRYDESAKEIKQSEHLHVSINPFDLSRSVLCAVEKFIRECTDDERKALDDDAEVVDLEKVLERMHYMHEKTFSGNVK